MYAEGTVTGPRSGISGANPIRLSKDGHLVVHDAHAKYLQAVLDGKVFIGANAAGTPVTTQAGLSATTPAFTLYNPAASATLLVLWQFGFAFTTAPAALTVACLATNTPQAAAPTSVTAANVVNALTGQSTGSTGQCYAIATLAAAPVARYYMPVVGAAAAVGVAGGLDYNLDGKVVLYSGVALSFQTLAATAVLCHCVWEEIPLSMVT